MARSKRGLWFEFGRFITGITVICFFLPFFGVSCGGMDVITVSGTDMVGGCKPGGLIADAEEKKKDIDGARVEIVEGRYRWIELTNAIADRDAHVEVHAHDTHALVTNDNIRREGPTRLRVVRLLDERQGLHHHALERIATEDAVALHATVVEVAHRLMRPSASPEGLPSRSPSVRTVQVLDTLVQTPCARATRSALRCPGSSS